MTNKKVKDVHIARIATVFDHYNLQILTPKLMLQKLLKTFAQVKSVNTSENVLNEIDIFFVSLYLIYSYIFFIFFVSRKRSY